MLDRNFKNHILVDFNMLFDLDLAIILFLIKKSTNNEYFNKDILNGTSYFLKYSLISRLDPNPLTILIDKEHKDSCINLYNEIINSSLNEVFSYMEKAPLFFVFNEFTELNGYKIIVNCINDIEQEYCKKICKFQTTVLNTNAENVSTLYIYNSKNLIKYKNIHGKTIYVSKQGFNTFNGDIKNNTLNEILLLLSKTNKILYIDKYINFKLPE